MSAAKWILEAYEKAGEEARLEMYMIYRDLREDFEEIEAGSSVQEVKLDPRVKADPITVRWGFRGRLKKAFG